MRAALFALCLWAPAAAAADDAAHVDYMLQCQGCHLADGTGSPGEVPSLVDVGRYLTVPGGREYLARVPGAALSPLSDAELAAVLNWIVSEFGRAGVAETLVPYSAAEVGPLRRDPYAEVAGPRARLRSRLGLD